MKHQNVFWGTILIIFGLLFLFDRLGVFNLEWFMVWRLWPILLVLWGVSILPLKGIYKLILAFVVAALSIFMYSNLDPEESPFRNNHIKFDFSDNDTIDNKDIDQEFSHQYDSVKTAVMHLEAGAGNFQLQGLTGELVYITKSGGNMVYDFKVEELDNHADITLKQESDVVLHGKNKNELRFMLNEKPVWMLDVEIGAANFDFDLSPFKVSKIDIDGGATSIKLQIGALQPETEINVNAAASSIHIRIPATAGCQITGSSILSHREAEGFVQIDKGIHETPNFETSTQKIKIKVDAAVSSFKIDRY